MKAVLAAVLACAAFAGTSGQTEAQPRAQPPASTVEFRNDLPPRYRVERVRISVDGYVWVDGPVATVSSGTHRVAIVADVRAPDPRLRGREVRFEARSAERVRAVPGRVVIARAVEVGGRERPVEKRVAIRWR